ncbi:hypothetical protein [Streptomyces sp. DSM 41634]|nr:hypothetical protein [Streptomyces sp. DSM 41633]
MPLEFALVSSNDWYRLPCDLPAGILASVRGLSVADGPVLEGGAARA